MSRNVSASLCFGIDCGEEYPLRGKVIEEDEYGSTYEFEDEEYDLGEYLAFKHGIKYPYTNEGDYDPESSGEDVKNWWKANKKLETLSPIEIIHYGTDEYYQYIVAIKGSEISTYGDTEVVAPSALYNYEKFVAIASAISTATEYCDQYDIPVDFLEAKWLLSASYG